VACGLVKQLPSPTPDKRTKILLGKCQHALRQRYNLTLSYVEAFACVLAGDGGLGAASLGKSRTIEHNNTRFQRARNNQGQHLGQGMVQLYSSLFEEQEASRARRKEMPLLMPGRSTAVEASEVPTEQHRD
jgi:hypothetical protein